MRYKVKGRKRATHSPPPSPPPSAPLSTTTATTTPGLDVASQAAAARPTGADRSGSADVSEASAGRPDIGQSADKQRRRPLRPRLLVVKQPITSWMPLLFLNLQFALPFLMTIAFVRVEREALEGGALACYLALPRLRSTSRCT